MKEIVIYNRHTKSLNIIRTKVFLSAYDRIQEKRKENVMKYKPAFELDGLKKWGGV
jgi:hypothetical protein